MEKPLMNSGASDLWDKFVLQGVPAEQILKKIDDHYLNRAIQEDSSGATCGFCKNPNNYADDCGFFYCVPLNYKYGEKDIKSLPVCLECYKSKPGENHIKLFGVGER